jgi:TfoX/Sxy family transcriptional regulator of competence genes
LARLLLDTDERDARKIKGGGLIWAWKKANKELIRLLESELLKYKCDRKMMFGSPTVFINNNMFAGVHEDTVIIRLSEGDRKDILSLYSEVLPFMPMEGRVMKEYAALPASVCSKAEIFEEWLNRSYQYAVSLPPKEKKHKRK